MLIAWDGMTPDEFRELDWRTQTFMVNHWAERQRRASKNGPGAGSTPPLN